MERKGARRVLHSRLHHLWGDPVRAGACMWVKSTQAHFVTSHSALGSEELQGMWCPGFWCLWLLHSLLGTKTYVQSGC